MVHCIYNTYLFAPHQRREHYLSQMPEQLFQLLAMTFSNQLEVGSTEHTIDLHHISPVPCLKSNILSFSPAHLRDMK